MQTVNTNTDDPAPQDPAPIPYTVRLGVTGHRQLPDAAAVAGAVAQTLVNIRDALQSVNRDAHHPITNAPSLYRRAENRLFNSLKRGLSACGILQASGAERQTKLRWQIYSSLAAGADQLVAEEALRTLDAELIAVLPFAAAEYRNDFQEPTEARDFDRLLGRSARSIPLNMPYAVRDESASPEKQQADTNVRNAGYRRGGEAIVDSCEILIAIWDGKPPRGQGGTAEIVEFALSLGRLVIWIDPAQPAQPARILRKLEKSAASPTEMWTPVADVLPNAATGLSPGLVSLAEYNRDRLFCADKFAAVLERNRAKLSAARSQAGLEDELVGPLLQSVLPHYARADQLAIAYQKRHLLAATWLYRLAALAVATGVNQALLFPKLLILTLVEILLLLGAVVWFRVSVCQGWHEKWLNYRHLAERLRTLLFTSLLPTSPPGHNPPRAPMLPFYPGPGGWIVEATERIKAAVTPALPAPIPFLQLRSFLREAWLRNQTTFHLGTAAKKKRQAHREHLAVAAMLGATLTVAFVHLLGIAGHGTAAQLLTVLAIILPAFASAQHAIASIHDNERIASRSARMADLLEDLERKLAGASDVEELAREIARVEDIMSTENHEWCVSLSYRGLSLPV